MDGIDLEIEQMLKEIKAERYTEFDLNDLKKIETFVTSFSGKHKIQIKEAVNRELIVRGAVINLLSGFDIFTDDVVITGVFFNSTSTRLEISLSKVPGIAYHNKDGRGKFIYVFPEGLSMIIRLRGKLVKWYDFEVLS
jgi:hypothetical protein